MTIRKATASFFYSSPSSIGWVRTLSAVIDEGLATLCMRQWQRVPLTIAQPATPPTRRRVP